MKKIRKKQKYETKKKLSDLFCSVFDLKKFNKFFIIRGKISQ